MRHAFECEAAAHRPPTLEPYSIIEIREHNVSMDICKNQLLFAGASILETPLQWKSVALQLDHHIANYPMLRFRVWGLLG